MALGDWRKEGPATEVEGIVAVADAVAGSFCERLDKNMRAAVGVPFSAYVCLMLGQRSVCSLGAFPRVPIGIRVFGPSCRVRQATRVESIEWRWRWAVHEEACENRCRPVGTQRSSSSYRWC